MSIADELNHYAGGLEDAYDAAQDMGAVIPANRNMDNLDTAIRTIPQPSVNDGILTITQNGTTAGSFTANQASNTTVALTDTTYSDFTGATSGAAGTHGLVPAPAAGDDGKFLQGDGTWGTPADTTYTAGTNVQISAQNVISATDTTYSAFSGATSSVAGSAGLVPAPTTSDPDKYLKGDGTWAEPAAKLVEMSYGESNAWAKFIAAYNAGSIVYCRASSNANPGTGSQTRKAFMAYVNNATTPTSVEFQYVRSVSSKTSSQPVDQVFVYTLTNANGGTWSVATRDMGPKLAAGTNTSVSYSSGTYTVSATDTTYSAFTGTDGQTAGTAGLVPAPATTDADKFLKSDGTWATAGGGGGAVTYYIADGDPNYPQTLSNGFIYEDAARTTRVEADDIYADIQSGKIVYLEYRTGPATDRRETLFSINSMTRRDTQGIVDRYDYFGTITSYMDGSSTTMPAAFGFLVQGTEPVTWQFVQQYIPTVNNGTLTIQQNGTTVDTFTANQSTNVTANIDTHNGVLTANDLSPATDTVADWLTLFNSTPGYYVTFYSGTTGFTNQPATWGQLETFISVQTNDPTKFEVYQKWHTQSDGEEYYRAGNSAGWFNRATDSGKFYKSESDNSANSWHTFGVTSATANWQTALLPGRVTCDIKPNGQGGIIVRNISSNNAIKKARVVATTYFTSSVSGKNFGIGDLATSTVYTRYSGLIGSTAKTWSQATNTASSGNANLFSDTFAMTSVSIEYVAVLSRPSLNSWLVEGTISATGSASFIQFSAECTAGDATKIPIIYVRGISSTDISDFNASVELFV